MNFSRLTMTGMVAILFLTPAVPAEATPGDTTWVRTFDNDFYNWATAHVDTFAFPDTLTHYSDIEMFYTIGCPDSPNDCDPWDRLGYLQVLQDTGELDSLGQPILERFEIGRIITPYDITGGSRPGTCTWEIDATDYKPLLHDTVVLRNYIESWIGGDDGWLVTVDFAFIEGESELEPYKVVNLWNDYYVLFGDPDEPIDQALQIRQLEIDPDVVSVKLRVTTTGHGQGNTDNCAEFCYKEHTLIVNGETYSYYPWRDDCNQNSCSPQGGTWQYDRAGWCPGDAVDPWDQDISAAVRPGELNKFNYKVEPYENFCRPTNPDCVSGVTCPDCDFNYNGHTPPHYSVQAQLISYRQGSPTGIGDDPPAAIPKTFALHQNYPNPFNPSTTISFDLPEGAEGVQPVELRIYSIRGKLVRTMINSKLDPGQYQVMWNGKSDAGEAVSSGIYIYSLKTESNAVTRKMLLLK